MKNKKNEERQEESSPHLEIDEEQMSTPLCTEHQLLKTDDSRPMEEQQARQQKKPVDEKL